MSTNDTRGRCLEILDKLAMEPTTRARQAESLKEAIGLAIDAAKEEMQAEMTNAINEIRSVKASIEELDRNEEQVIDSNEASKASQASKREQAQEQLSRWISLASTRRYELYDAQHEPIARLVGLIIDAAKEEAKAAIMPEIDDAAAEIREIIVHIKEMGGELATTSDDLQSTRNDLGKVETAVDEMRQEIGKLKASVDSLWAEKAARDEKAAPKPALQPTGIPWHIPAREILCLDCRANRGKGWDIPFDCPDCSKVRAASGPKPGPKPAPKEAEPADPIASWTAWPADSNARIAARDAEWNKAQQQAREGQRIVYGGVTYPPSSNQLWNLGMYGSVTYPIAPQGGMNPVARAEQAPPRAEPAPGWFRRAMDEAMVKMGDVLAESMKSHGPSVSWDGPCDPIGDLKRQVARVNTESVGKPAEPAPIPPPANYVFDVVMYVEKHANFGYSGKVLVRTVEYRHSANAIRDGLTRANRKEGVIFYAFSRNKGEYPEPIGLDLTPIEDNAPSTPTDSAPTPSPEAYKVIVEITPKDSLSISCWAVIKTGYDRVASEAIADSLNRSVVTSGSVRFRAVPLSCWPTVNDTWPPSTPTPGGPSASPADSGAGPGPKEDKPRPKLFACPVCCLKSEINGLCPNPPCTLSGGYMMIQVDPVGPKEDKPSEPRYTLWQCTGCGHISESEGFCPNVLCNVVMVKRPSTPDGPAASEPKPWVCLLCNSANKTGRCIRCGEPKPRNLTPPCTQCGRMGSHLGTCPLSGDPWCQHYEPSPSGA